MWEKLTFRVIPDGARSKNVSLTDPWKFTCVQPWALCMLSLTLCDAMDCSHQAPLSVGFCRQEYWSGLPCPPIEKWNSLSLIRLFVTPWTVYGILQAMEWVAFPFSRGSSQPRNRTQVSHIAGRFFTSRATRGANYLVTQVITPNGNPLKYWCKSRIWVAYFLLGKEIE